MFLNSDQSVGNKTYYNFSFAAAIPSYLARRAAVPKIHTSTMVMESKSNALLVVAWLLLAAAVGAGEGCAAWRRLENTVEAELDYQVQRFALSPGNISPDVYKPNKPVCLPHQGCAAPGERYTPHTSKVCRHYNREAGC